MDVRSGRMNVQVDKPRSVVGVADRQAGLLARLAQRGLSRRLAGVDMPARLHPATHPLVPVQYGAAGSDHDGRAGHMHRVRSPVERVRQPVKLGQKPRAGTELPWRRRIELSHRGPQHRRYLLKVHASHALTMPRPIVASRVPTGSTRIATRAVPPGQFPLELAQILMPASTACLSIAASSSAVNSDRSAAARFSSS
jgi:hypothetical protein